MSVKFMMRILHVPSKHFNFSRCIFTTLQAVTHLQTYWFLCFLCTVPIGVTWRCYADVVLIRATASKAPITTGNIAMNWLYERKKKFKNHPLREQSEGNNILCNRELQINKDNQVKSQNLSGLYHLLMKNSLPCCILYSRILYSNCFKMQIYLST